MSLSRSERDALPASDFAVPDKRALPIHDAKHVAMAWSQVGRAKGLSDGERAAARRRIIDRAHSLSMDTEGWDTIHAMRLDAMAVELPDCDDHPNRMPFSGVLVKLDQPSDAAPHGSNGKLVLMGTVAAQAALASLIGMGVDITPDFDGHDAKRKIGVITEATVKGSDLVIAGYIYAADFPEEAAWIKANKKSLGFSFEAQQIHVESLDQNPLVITACVFTGAAILKKDKAAFTSTSLAASAARGVLDMDKEELKALLLETVAPINARLDTIEASNTALSEKIEAGKELHAKVAPHADKLRACSTAMQAAGIGVHASRGHVAILNRMADSMEAEAMAGSMPHIYRDHDYAPSVYAGAERTEEKRGDDPEIKALKDEVASLGTKVADAIAAGRAEAKEPERKTLPPQLTALLARADLTVPDSGKFEIGKIDAALKDLPMQDRLRAKAALGQAGLI